MVGLTLPGTEAAHGRTVLELPPALAATYGILFASGAVWTGLGVAAIITAIVDLRRGAQPAAPAAALAVAVCAPVLVSCVLILLLTTGTARIS